MGGEGGVDVRGEQDEADLRHLCRGGLDSADGDVRRLDDRLQVAPSPALMDDLKQPLGPACLMG
jgi:hypothetical protein